MRAYFLSRLARERILLVLLAVAIGAVVVSWTARTVAEFVRLDRRINNEIAVQKVVLGQKDLIAMREQSAAQMFDAARTYDALRLSSEIDSMTRSAGIKNSSTGDARTETSTQFSIHSVQLTMRNSDYATLVRFYQEVMKKVPYIGIDQFSISANVANPTQLNAQWRLSSVEINR